MFCNKCGKQIAEGSMFCNFCGAPVEVPVEPAAPEVLAEEPAAKNSEKPVFEEFNWNVNDYPSKDKIRKTEDIDFDWNADPKDVKDRFTRGLSMEERAEVAAGAELSVEDLMPSKAQSSASAQSLWTEDTSESAKESPASEIEKFYTFNSKNEEFQKLLDREYDKIRTGNPIGQEQSVADKTAAQKFEERPKDNSMEAFLEREGAVRSYEPKAFESDVLQRIEAQERAKEQARLEEEAREKALEEARLKAEEEMRIAEEARLKAEEAAREAAIAEARARAEEEARERAVAEAKAKAEELARKAEEEAKRAEEEMRLRALEEERIRAEEEERKRAEEEEKRLKAEAEYRAQQEAQKIKEQREARMAALEAERRSQEAERRSNEEASIRERLAAEQENLARQANSAAAAEEVRTALAQTARMKAEEEAKIRAEIAKLKGGFASRQEPAEQAAPAPEAPAVQVEPEVPAAPEAPVTPVTPVIEETPAEAADHAIEAKLEGDRRAHQAHRDNLSEMARARAEFLSEFGIDPDEKAPAKEPVPATVEELLGEKPVTGRNTMLDNSELVQTRTVDKAAVLAGLGTTVRISKSELKEIEDSLQEIPSAPAEPDLKLKSEDATVEDLLNRFAETSADEIQASEQEAQDMPAPAQEAQEAEDSVAAEGGFAPKEEPALEPAAGTNEALKPGLDDTMVMPAAETKEEEFPGSFDSYGEKEAAEFKRRQEEDAAKAMDNFYGGIDDDFAGEGEQKFAGEDSGEEEEEGREKGGAGRIVLKVLLVILIVIFAVELAGIGIKFLAPNSGAAEFIDNQLNKVIHLITGSETDYSIPGTDYEV
ncbi:MAG: zinc-ribbon domain-containing protein [Clostridiales bacterium]|nr:zinc-ribbon domain-containing protein [Clostridiales bacterium]